MICLTTMHDRVKVTNDQRLKPPVIVMYDHTKGGVNVVDLISCHHSTRTKSKRWPLTTFAFMLDTIKTNSKTILEDNKKNFNNFEFTYQLGKALVLQKIRRRLENSNGLQIAVLQKVRRVLGLPEVNRRPLPDPETAPTSTGRCYKCVESIVGTKTYKTDPEKMNNKLKAKCSVCSGFICKKHQYKLEFTCEDCFEKWYFSFFCVYLKDIWCIFVILHISKARPTWFFVLRARPRGIFFQIEIKISQKKYHKIFSRS